jgi:hypothetical protein
MARRLTNRATLCWLLASAGLLGLIAVQETSKISLAPSVTAAPTEAVHVDEELEKAEIVSHLTIDSIDEIIDRPLFSSSRRPASVPEQEVIVAAATPKVEFSATLAGTMLAGDSRMALLTHPSKGLLRLREGQEVDGWRIEDVRVDEVRLTNGDEVTLLRLRKDTPSKGKAKALGAKTAAPAAANAAQSAPDENRSEVVPQPAPKP